MKQSLILVRHARSEHNVGATNDLDSKITDFGIEQAKIVGRYLARGGCGEDISEYTFYVSPLQRCLMTMDYILKESGLSVTPKVEPLLGEYLYPECPSVEVPCRHQDYPHFDWWYAFAQNGSVHVSDIEPRVYAPETNERYLGRMQRAFDSFDEKSFVVTHGMPVMTIALEATHRLSHLPMWDHSINNCSITWIKRGRKRWWGRNLHHEVVYQDHLEHRVVVDDHEKGLAACGASK